MTNVSAYLICHEFKREIEKVWNSNGTICHFFFANFFHLKTVESQIYNLNPIHLIRGGFSMKRGLLEHPSVRVHMVVRCVYLLIKGITLHIET